ncbi:uncharacterized protein LOC114243509 [Bombyx mandarina]|uniref:Uncharacterized protein LOC114243509 n=1 Tax=Bombyx mandarina TaxID=7092 RepID=A0A6J2JMB5_BOMMA|nr:uncharacterized protein LOC114243509 [Bombyx mandarina]
MSKLYQILVSYFVIQCYFITIGKPLFKGISIKKGFDISFIPLPKKPLSFITEKWSPFGIFGVKHAIQKRELIEEEEPIVTMKTSLQPPPMPTITPLPPTPAGPMKTILINEDVSRLPIDDSIETMSSAVVPVPLEPPLSSNFEIIPTTKEEKGPSGFYTDISRAVPVNNYLNLVERPAFPAVAPVVENELPPNIPSVPKENPNVDPLLENNSIVRGSKLALYFSNLFLQLFSQFLANARVTLNQFSDPTV